MKKSTLVIGFLFIFMLVGSVKSNAMGDDIMFGNWQNPMTLAFQPIFGSGPPNNVVVTLFPGSILRVELNVLVAEFSVAGRPPLYVAYAFGQHRGITAAVSDSDLVPEILNNGNLVYRATFLLEFEFAAQCTVPNAQFEIPVSLALVTDNSEGYPVLNHEGFFPLGWFNQTIFPFPPPEMRGEKTIECPSLLPPGPVFSRSEIKPLNSRKAFKSTISPNPFHGETKLEYLMESNAPFEIEVLGSTGKLVYEKRYRLLEKGLHQEVLQLDDLFPGIYFVRLISQNNSEMIKVVKN